MQVKQYFLQIWQAGNIETGRVSIQTKSRSRLERWLRSFQTCLYDKLVYSKLVLAEKVCYASF